MTTRILPAQEWATRLAETDFGPIVGRLNPAATTIVVAEQGDELLGCWGLITFAHVEGLWIAPAHRKRGRVLVRLWDAMRRVAMGRSIDVVYTGALCGDVERLLESRHAERLPPMYALPLEPLGRSH